MDKVISFYVLNRRKVHGYAAALFAAVVLAIVCLTWGPSAKASSEAKLALEQWKKDPSDLQLQQAMRQALKKAPDFNRSVQAEIAQTLLASGRSEEARSVAGLCVERLREDAPLHAAFAETSLLIEQGHYQRALEASVALKERMEPIGAKAQAIEVGSALYAWNLLRIASLQNRLGNEPGERSAWEDVRELLALPGLSVGRLLEANFGVGNFGLTDFIAHREEGLAR